jgi:hypothetical protein
MKATIQCLAALAFMLWAQSELTAQSILWTGGNGPGLNWTTPANWDQLTNPNSNFHDFAFVGSAASPGVSSPIGVANVTADIRATNPSPSVVLGADSGTSGTLNISSTGKFKSAAGPLTTGAFTVGQNGAGVLNVASGGVLEVAAGLATPGTADAASTISLTGTASVTAASASLNRNLIVDGSNVNFSVAGNLILGSTGIHTWQIPATGASTLKAGGNADLGGTLKLVFPSGTPTVGTTWNLIDAATIDANEGSVGSSFANIDASAVTGLAAGQGFRLQSVAGGTHGRLAQLVLERQPVLTINRQTGAMSLTNPAASATVGFDVYQIQSAMGALNPATWTSIAPANGWFQANPNHNVLSELHPVGTATIAGSSSISLGTPFAPPSLPFGTNNEDVTFQYSVPGGGLTNGQVQYIGVPTNNLTLNVDPATGQAQIINGSNRTVSIDNYTISSASGSLKFANGTWNSLQDQGTSGNNWFEANTSSKQIAELLTVGGLQLAPNAKISLGAPFNTLGQQDLVFQFAVTNNLPGDFNGNGIVDAADYTVWRDNLGSTSNAVLHGNGDATLGVGPGDYTLWKANFGTTALVSGPPALITGRMLYSALVPGAGSAASASPVSEPSTAWLLVVGLPLVMTMRRSK